jgi:hypothetical protein
VRRLVSVQEKELEKNARQLHQQWLKANKDYIGQCRSAPEIYNCSRDFKRIFPWKTLPDYWKNYYRREARYQLLIKTTE